jgi:hypothetical protein
MTVNTDKLFKISTYAAKKNVSITTILNKADKGELKLVLIDGVKFILEK